LEQAYNSGLLGTIWDFGLALRDALTGLAENDDAAPVLEEVQAAAARDGRTAELAAAYAEQLSLPHSPLKMLPPVQRLEACLQAAWVCSEEEGHEASTLAAVLAALDISAADERALALAEPLLLGAEEYVELANRYSQASLSALTEQRARQLLERGLHVLSPLLGSAPALMGLNERLARLGAMRRSSFPPAAADSALLEAQLRRALESEDLATRRESRARLGELLIAHGRAGEGLALWLPELDETVDLADLDLLERLSEQAGDQAALERVILRRTELDAGPEERARALERLGTFYCERADEGDAERAATAFSAAGDQYWAHGAPDDAERAYELLLNAVPTHAAAAAKLVRLRALAGDFTRVAEAFGIVLRNSDDVRSTSELLLEIEPDAARVGAVDEFAELVEDLLWRLAGSSDNRDAERLLRCCARLFSNALRIEEAKDAYRRLISEHGRPEDARAFEALIDAHPSSDWRRHERRWLFEWLEGQSPDKSAVLLNWADVEEREWGDPGAALSVLERAAALGFEEPELWQRLARLRLHSGNVEAGLAAVERLRNLGAELDGTLLAAVIEHRPATRWALDRLKLILSAQQRFQELLELYDRALDATADSSERATLLDEAAVAARDVAGLPERAIAYWERYAALVPGEARVDLALERLYERGGLSSKLIAHLNQRALRSTGSARVSIERRLVQLALDSGEFGAARTALERMREDDPASASTELERLLRLELEGELPLEKRRLRLAELSRLYERDLAQPERAFAAQRELFRSLPSKERERKRLEKLARKLGRFGDVCDDYSSIASAWADEALSEALLARAYELAKETLHDSERAIAIARRRLARPQAGPSEERRTLHLELVDLLEAKGDLAAARRELALLARQYPTDAPVLFRSARAAEAAQAWADAEQNLRSLLLILHGSPPEQPELCRAAVYVELSQIRRHAGDEPGAAELIDSAFEAALISPAEAHGLEAALRVRGRSDLLERACMQRLAQAESPSALARVLGALAELSPGSSDAPSAQAVIRAAEQLADVLEAESGADMLQEALPHGLAACVRLLPEERARQLLARHQGRLSGADRETLSVALAGRLLAIPDYRAEALARLEEVARRGELADAQWPRLAEAWEASGELEKLRWALTRWLEREPENAGALAQSLRLALGNGELTIAAELFERLTAAPGGAGAPGIGKLRRELQQALARAGEHERAAQLLLEDLPDGKDKLKRAAQLAEAGELFQRAGNTSAAASAAEEALTLDPSLPEAALLLAQLARARGERSRALSLLTAQAEHKERRRSKGRARLLRLLADLELEQDELAEAFLHLSEAHQLDKTDLDTALVLGLLAMDLNRFDTAAAALRVILAQREIGSWENPAAKASSLARACFQLARIELQYGRKTGAKRMLSRALEEDPECRAAQGLLGTLEAS
jgi:tetratricopeptide (TPR) repeat protein